MAERKRRITKGDTFTFCRDEKTGELQVHCLFCEAVYAFKHAWEHRCDPSKVKHPEDPFKPDAE